MGIDLLRILSEFFKNRSSTSSCYHVKMEYKVKISNVRVFWSFEIRRGGKQ